MKTYKEFMSEAAPLLAAPLIIKGIGAGLAATGLTGMIMQARKQGEGRRSQPVDYGQGGTATPRGKSVQRGRLNPNDAYNRAKREERKQEAQRRARERAEQGIDELIGSEEERRYAKQKRKERGIEEQTTRLVNVRTVGGITRGIDPSTGEIRIIKGRTKKEQDAVKNPPGFEMY
tara:strand:+ start:466 stop:990 length:525 start_codon:yes stop_codon:yes gene_type:complete